MNLIVLIPAYNEGQSIYQTVTSVKNSAMKPKVLVVNDGSKDNTLAEVERAGADYIVNHKINRGLGAAIRSGLKKARELDADIVVKFDADLQHNPADIERMIQPLINDTADIVYGYRFAQINYKMPFVRRVGNKVFTSLMAFLTKWPIKDSQPGIFAVNKDFLSDFYLPGNYNYTQQVLLDGYHRGLRFEHVSVEFNKRETGKSFISLKYPFKVIPQMFMVIVGTRPLKILGSLGAVFLSAGILSFLIEILLWMTGVFQKPIQHPNLISGLALFGLQTLFFGILAELIVNITRNR